MRARRSFPSRVRSTHAAEHRHAAVLQGDVVNQLHDDDGLADAGTAEETDLAPCRYGSSRSMDLDAVSNIFRSVELILERRRGPVNRTAFLRLHRTVREVHRLARGRSVRGRASRDRRAPRSVAEIDGVHSASKAVGRLHRDRATRFSPVLATSAMDTGAGRAPLRVHRDS